jgi:hypothetical protein
LNWRISAILSGAGESVNFLTSRDEFDSPAKSGKSRESPQDPLAHRLQYLNFGTFLRANSSAPPDFKKCPNGQ